MSENNLHARDHAEIDHGIEFRQYGVLGWDWRVKTDQWTRERPPFSDEAAAVKDAIQSYAADCHTCEMFTWDFEDEAAV